MARFRNDHGEARIVPTLGYTEVPEGGTVTVPDEEWEHWDAGGWTALDPDPRPAPEDQAEPEPEPQPAPAAAKPSAPAPAPELPAPAAAVPSEDQS